ncbi:tail fiber domain-containing protein [Hymenobacter cellulosivorans]|uniref:Tail fiber domain-containing protein n=1 Tax=Hymenobacter cellulosivorans TaxID=2932249 RepID=A0ABY4FBS5_9BACT|nr:tail fiber domain-containing protein [Hymenobacter cellulosivorans]UOQ53532.1 tail fiber domain-containing protein [Hymenobacter cellulosivorans]
MKAPLLTVSAALLLAAPTATVQAQSVGIGTTTPASSAILDVTSPNPATAPQGFLPPRLTQAQRQAIQQPAAGLLVYQTDAPAGLYLYGGSSWSLLPTGTSSGAADNLGNHTAIQPISFTTTAADKLTLTPGGSGGPKIGVSAPDNLDLYAGNLTATSATLRVLTPEDGAWQERLRVDRNGLLAEGETYVGGIPKEGAGIRLMWYPGKAAFRAGRVNGAQWNDNNVGLYSVALGSNSTALGDNSVVLGPSNTARQGSAVAIGEQNVANGYASFALGYRANTNAKPGSFVFGDFSTSNEILSSVNNQATFRVSGGFRIYTNANLLSGVTIAANGSSWETVSDSTKKERLVLADGNQFLARINRMRLGSWNYRGLDPATTRHYGPMAQDFHAAFGRDAIGTIGTDTTINQADFDGVNLIAIQALYRRVLQLEAANARLQEQVKQLQTRQPGPAGSTPATAAALEERLRRLEAQLGAQAQR